MTKEELYLKNIFCCIACDGDIATEEIEMVRSLCIENELFRNMDSEKLLNSWIVEINEHGGPFLQSYLKEINTVELDEKEAYRYKNMWKIWNYQKVLRMCWK